MSNIFEKHKKMTIVSIVVFSAICIFVLTVLVIKAVRDDINRGYERYIVMREGRLNSVRDQAPGEHIMKHADSLEVRKYRMRIDKDGYIMPSRVHANPDFTFVFVGGSTTECAFMEESDRFPYLVGRLLEESTGKKINTLNSSYPGNNTFHSVFLLLSKIVPEQPRAVILMEACNDLNFLMHTKGYWSNHVSRGIVRYHVYNPLREMLFKFAHGKRQEQHNDDEFFETRNTKLVFDADAAAREYKKMLSLFVYVCKTNNIIPILMTQPNRARLNPDETIRKSAKMLADAHDFSWEDYVRGYERFNQTIRDTAQENDIPLIDLEAQVEKSSRYLYDSVHLNGTGSRFVANLIAQALTTKFSHLLH